MRVGLASDLIRGTLLSAALATVCIGGDDNGGPVVRDKTSPWYPGLHSPKLITPQWVNEPGVEAVVIFGIDDMRDTAKYEAFLRPILQRLKQIEGRAPLSIMTCKVKPEDPQLQSWLDEGLSIEVHTVDHPCPLLHDGDLDKARSTYNRCVDLLAQIPGNRPVAFRTPCCDSLNTVSPRFFAEIFNAQTSRGNALQLDTSVFNFFTSDDPAIPRDLVIDSDGQDRFLKYFPADRGFVNDIRNYPYPYVINEKCWEFPCVAPSDWSAQHRHGVNNPVTVADWKAALDITVMKQGVFCLVFHPHGWITSDQIVELIDHAVEKHGPKVKFLSFRDAAERLNSLIPLRQEGTFARVLDIHRPGQWPRDGYVDLFTEIDGKAHRRVWVPAESRWKELDGAPLAAAPVRPDAVVSATAIRNAEQSVDYNDDGQPELTYDVASRSYRGRFPPPAEVPLDGGVRFLDLNGDGLRDIIHSNHVEYSVWLNTQQTPGPTWRRVAGGRRGTAPPTEELPPIILADGSDNGFFARDQALYWQNENTNKLPHLVDVRTFDSLLQDDQPTARSPQASLRSIHVREGFRVELVAAEPLVQDPVGFDWGDDGRLWVVEMPGYPNGVTNENGDLQPAGRVRALTDTDGDGQFDKSTIFLDQLNFPSAVMSWREGVLVSAAPEILYAADTDGDGRADIREVLFSGFGEGNQQHRANGFSWGLDNEVHIANGDSGGTIRSVRTGQTLDLRSHDLKIDPRTGAMSAVSGRTQFGRNRDDWGNWFGCNNSNPMWHYVLDERYLARNPSFAPPDIRHTVPEVPGNAPVFPRSRTLERFNDFHTANRFTSACSTTILRSSLFGRHFAGNSFTCEPVHNLVSRLQLQRAGSTFVGRRAVDERDREFLASSDNWFRPVFARTGPDGALWIADMYRHVIEHPKWIPEDWQRRLDLRAGHAQGRIYRVVPAVSSTPPASSARRDSPELLLQDLAHDSGTRRDTAQRRLVELADPGTTESLVQMARAHNSPQARLHAMCTLDGLGKLTADDVLDRLADRHPGVRRQALRLAEQFTGDERLRDAVIALSSDDDPGVRLQLACTLGQFRTDAAARALAQMLHGSDRFLLAAAMSSLNEQNLATVVAEVVRSDSVSSAVHEQVLGLAVRSSRPDALVAAARSLGAALRREGTARHRATIRSLATILRLKRPDQKLPDIPQEDREAFFEVLLAASRAVSEPAGHNHTIGFVRDAMGLTGAFVRDQNLPFDTVATTAARYFEPNMNPQLQTAAVEELGRFSEDEVATLLIDQWPRCTPALRNVILDSLLSRSNWTWQLLNALEQKQVAVVDIDALHRQRLLESRTPKVRQRAATLLRRRGDATRAQILERIRKTLPVSGDAVHGRTVFEKRCATCHQLAGLGKRIGADLLSLRDKSTPALLTAILDPNQAVESRFVSYTIVLTSGRTVSGMIKSESGNAVTLIGADGREHTVLRSDIDELVSSDKSLMPEGLEKDLSPQDLADVMAFVQSGVAAAPRSFAGNSPTEVHPSGNGRLRLTARNCEIHGPNLVFESHFGNLGFWAGPEDRAVWNVHVARPGIYRIRMTYAVAGESAGNAFRIRSPSGTVEGTVASTGTWNDYRQVDAGQLVLPTGSVQIVLEPKSPPRNYLMDLRELLLIPVSSD